MSAVRGTDEGGGTEGCVNEDNVRAEIAAILARVANNYGDVDVLKAAEDELVELIRDERFSAAVDASAHPLPQ